jgi:two-component system sensor histidine kinase AlgZ
MRGAAPSPGTHPHGRFAAFPDFRNLGILLRGLLLAEAIHFVHLLAAQGNPIQALEALAGGVPLYEVTLLATLLLLFAASPRLTTLPFRQAAALSTALAALVAMAVHGFFSHTLPAPQGQGVLLSGVLAALTAALILFYFHWRQLVLSPALADARLMALQARIRPHFLYNSLNTVLGLMRQDPRRAEGVLEDLADLFRALMAEPRVLVTLARELELARAYVEVEALRLGDRLRLIWHCDGAPLQALVPQLMLQPLIENAVIHGIEPNPAGGEVHVNVFAKGERLLLVVRNPVGPATPTRPGNRMALANIRERLDLHFDAEARMTHFIAGGEFVVQVEIPLRLAGPGHAGR